MNMEIEDCIFDNNLPVNTIAMLNRLEELLKENETNSLLSESCKMDARIKRLFWLLNSQVYGQVATIDMYNEWSKLHREFKENNKEGGVL